MAVINVNFFIPKKFYFYKMEFKKEISFPMSEETFMNIFRYHYTQMWGDGKFTYREVARELLNYDEAGKLIGTSECIPLDPVSVLLQYDAETQTATFISFDTGLLSVDQTPSCIVLTVCNYIAEIWYASAYIVCLIDKKTGSAVGVGARPLPSQNPEDDANALARASRLSENAGGFADDDEDAEWLN